MDRMYHMANITTAQITYCKDCEYGPTEEDRKRLLASPEIRKSVCLKHTVTPDYVNGGTFTSIEYCSNKNKNGNCEDFKYR